MSRNGSFYAEIWDEEKWEPIPTPKSLKGKYVPIDCVSIDIAYELYAALVG